MIIATVIQETGTELRVLVLGLFDSEGLYPVEFDRQYVNVLYLNHLWRNEEDTLLVEELQDIVIA